MWRSHVAAWRASGETAEAFATAHGLTVGTLRWWSSRLQREARKPVVRLARVVRATPKVDVPEAHEPGRMTIELLDLRVRVVVQGRIDQTTLGTVLVSLREAAR